MQTKLADVLDFALSTLELISRRDFGLILMGIRQCESEREANRWLCRMERQQCLRREGRGAQARFAVHPARAQQSSRRDPERHWNQPWDGRWRIFLYDLPEKRRTERVMLWRALHARKLGLLQRSVWVWPHDVEPMLQDILEASGVPECFCGFVGERLFLCDDNELVSTAWNFKTINACQLEYLDSILQLTEKLQGATDLRALASSANQEHLAYEQAFSQDPLLPRRLWPKSYRGHTVEQRHAKFRTQLRARMKALATN